MLFEWMFRVEEPGEALPDGLFEMDILLYAWLCMTVGRKLIF
jgi:hypothetical protein